MRLLLISLFALLTISSQAQRKVHFLLDYTKTELNNTKLDGLSLGAELNSKWQVTYDYSNGEGTAKNLPSGYMGPELITKMSTHSINLGRKFNAFDTDKMWLNVKAGIQKANYKEYDNFELIPLEDQAGDGLDFTGIGVIDIFIWPWVLFDNDENISHTFETVHSEHIGLNGQLMLEGLIYNRITIGIGSKLVADKKTQEASIIGKIGIRF